MKCSFLILILFSSISEADVTSAITSIEFFNSSCTGFLLDVGETITDNSHPYVMTNGHCSKDPKKILELRGEPDDIEVTFYKPGGEMLAKPAVVEFYTQTGLDMAILRIDGISTKELSKQGISGLKLSGKKPQIGEAITRLTRLGKYKPIEITSCELKFQTDLLENGMLTFGSYRTSCSGQPGNSGSPFLSSISGAVVALDNTGDDDTGVMCSRNNPCEIGPDGHRARFPKAEYGQRVTDAAHCFDKQGAFNLHLPQCKLHQ